MVVEADSLNVKVLGIVFDTSTQRINTDLHLYSGLRLIGYAHCQFAKNEWRERSQTNSVRYKKR